MNYFLKKLTVNYFFILLLLLITGCNLRKSSSSNSANLLVKPDSVYSIMKKVADWQTEEILSNGFKHSERDWTNATLYTGLLKFAELSNDGKYYQFMKEKVGDKFKWNLYKDRVRYHADYYAVGQTYSRFYELYKDPKMIEDLTALADTLLARPHNEPLNWKNGIAFREWAWCDALFMAPPTLAMLSKATNNTAYLDLCDKLWWKTTDFLYDKDAHLYFRDERFLNKKEKNGEKVFWARGNGWVLAGLVRVLENMPKDYSQRGKWLKLYHEMIEKVATLQNEDGTWRTSLLDPESHPMKETSGTAFFTYALAWGINNGILDKKIYSPSIWKAWKALDISVHPNGMLGHVQKISAAPGIVTYDDTEVYGVGAFLLAGNEMLKIAMDSKKHKDILIVKNTSSNPQKISNLLNNNKDISFMNMLTKKTLSSSTLINEGTTLYLKKID